jgi:hypothetical protein
MLPYHVRHAGEGAARLVGVHAVKIICTRDANVPVGLMTVASPVKLLQGIRTEI